jgi:hypothetical protein
MGIITGSNPVLTTNRNVNYNMEKKYFLTNEEFTKFLEEIGGVKNGFSSKEEIIKEKDFFSVSNGWLGLIKEMMEDIISMGWNKEVCQVKEKFGGLRFYINNASNEVHDRITQTENLSYQICEICGESGKLRTDIGWYLTLCDEHYNLNKKKNL